MKKFIKKHWKNVALITASLAPFAYVIYVAMKHEPGLTPLEEWTEVTIYDSKWNKFYDVVIIEADKVRANFGGCSSCHESVKKGELYGNSRWSDNYWHTNCLQVELINQR